jgi:hypothetical protein
MKKITIEKLLHWAFREELPKIGAGTVSVPGFSPTDVLAGLIELGTGIDKSPNGFGVISGYVYEGEPHPDAILVGEAVRAIGDGRGIDIDAGWAPFPEWDDPHGLIAAAVERVRQRENGRSGRTSARSVAAMMMGIVMVGREPDWHADEPKTAMILKNGKPAWFVKSACKDSFGRDHLVEEDGYDKRKQRPKAGAYRKYRLTENIEGAILDRMEWQLWQSALVALHQKLSAGLQAHMLLPSEPNYHPWARISQKQAEKILASTS